MAPSDELTPQARYLRLRRALGALRAHLEYCRSSAEDLREELGGAFDAKLENAGNADERAAHVHTRDRLWRGSLAAFEEELRLLPDWEKFDEWRKEPE
jgi:hypothetical protein